MVGFTLGRRRCSAAALWMPGDAMSSRVTRVFTWPAVVLVVSIAGLTPTHSSSQAPTTAAAQRPNTARDRQTVDKYCVTCHNARLKTANLDLSAVDVTA